MRIRVAAAPVNWGVFNVEPGNAPPDEILDVIVDAGYEGCELGPLGYLAESPADLERRFVSRGLKLVAAFVATDLARPLTPDFEREFEGVAGLLAAGNAEVMLLSDATTAERAAVSGRVEWHPETWWSDENWAQMRQNTRLLGERAAAQGLTLAFHPHAATHVESEREIDLLLGDGGENLRLCLDTGHIMIGGADPVEVLAKAGRRVTLIHAKDVDGPILSTLRAGETSYFDAVDNGLYSDLGDGTVNWDGIVSGLNQIDFEGWLVVEQDRTRIPNDPRPAASIRRNRDFVRRMFGA